MLSATGRLVGEVGASRMWSHHVIGNALAGLVLTADVEAALGVTADDLRLALREGIARRWPAEDELTWDRLLGPTSAASMGEQARQTLQRALALTGSREGTATDEADVLYALLAGESGERLLTALLDPDHTDPPTPRLTEAMVERYGVQEPGSTVWIDSPLQSLTVGRRAIAVAQATTGQPTVEIEHLLAAAVMGAIAPRPCWHRLGVDDVTLREPRPGLDPAP